MSYEDFKPISNIYGISGTSYLVQLAIIHNKWAIVLLKAKVILDYYIFKDLDVDKLPERDRIVKWILSVIPFNINPHHIINTVLILLKEADENKEKKKIVASKEDCIQAKEKLKKVDELELRTSTSIGRVIEAKPHQAVAEKSRTILSETIENLEKVITILKKIISEDFLSP
jgi:hypothetical protein